MRKVIRTSDAPKPLGVYSQAILSDGFVFVAGQVPVNPATGQLELGDIHFETRRVLRNIAAILHTAGSSLAEAVRLGVFLANVDDFPALNEVFAEFFPMNPPARTTIFCTLPKNIKVEIDCIARVKRRKGCR